MEKLVSQGGREDVALAWILDREVAEKGSNMRKKTCLVEVVVICRLVQVLSSLDFDRAVGVEEEEAGRVLMVAARLEVEDKEEVRKN